MNSLLHKLRSLFRRGVLDRDMDDELRFHIEEQTHTNLAAGMSPDEAALAARKQFGWRERIREEAQEARGAAVLDRLGRDLRFAVRSLFRRPGFAIVAIVMLALGIGMSTSMFSVTNFVLLRSMPFPEGDRLVRVFATKDEAQAMPLSPADYFDIKAAATSFSGMSAVVYETANVAEPDQPPIPGRGINVTAEFLQTMGIQTVLGRGFAPDEDQRGKGKVALLPHHVWTSRFGADPKVVGRTLRIGTNSVVVIGVLPPVFDEAMVWGGTGFLKPAILGEGAFSTDRTSRFVHVVARLKQGASLHSAQSELDTIAARLAADHPEENSRRGMRVTELYASNVDDGTRRFEWLITALAALVLVIACANLAGIQIARSFSRAHELATQSALGARRADLMRPAILESLFLAAAAGVLGIVVAGWLNAVVSHSFSFPGFTARILIDSRVALFAFALCAVTVVAFGVAPAWLSSRVASMEALKLNSRSSTSGGGRFLKLALVSGQFALVVVLVSAATSFGIAIKTALQHDLGWKPGELFATTIQLPYGRYRDHAKRREFIHAARETLGQIPGVTGTTLSLVFPIHSLGEGRVMPEGAELATPGQEPRAMMNMVDAGYFSALQIPFKQGRTFSEDVSASGPPVVVVNETVARSFWPNESAIGKRLRLVNENQSSEVVGVVGDVTMALNFDRPATRLQVYRPLEQVSSWQICIGLKTHAPAGLDMDVRRALASIDRDVVVQPTSLLSEQMSGMLSRNDLVIFVLGAFALIGLLIALLGVYGVVTQLTIQRTREIGIRIALGADYGAVVRLILSQGVRLILFGVMAGLLGAFAVDQIYRATMPELQLPNFGVRAGIMFFLCLVGFAACWLPARRAAKVDPLIALRAE